MKHPLSHNSMNFVASFLDSASGDSCVNLSRESEASSVDDPLEACINQDTTIETSNPEDEREVTNLLEANHVNTNLMSF